MSKREAPLVAELPLVAATHGDYLWRNNVGACFDQTGRLIRYGLGNTSKAVNQVSKSSDLIGITRRLITPEMVGMAIAQFTSLEAKQPGWVYAGTPREVAQKAWIDLIVSLGGIGKFVTKVEDVYL